MKTGSLRHKRNRVYNPFYDGERNVNRVDDAVDARPSIARAQHAYTPAW